MRKIGKFLKDNLAKVSAGLLALSLLILPAVANVAKAADFDATDSTEIVTTAVGGVTPTLRNGIILILAVVLGIWAIFFVIGKMKKHVK